MDGTIEPKLICVDLQRDFAEPEGLYHIPGESTGFLKEVLFPEMHEWETRSLEIISDYRQPRRGDPRDCCRPGDPGFFSLLPDDLKRGDVWIKSMNSPIWVRENAGDGNKPPGEPYQDPRSFDIWLEENLGTPQDTGPVVIFGLAADRCILCTAQELSFRGYDVRVLREGTDVTSGDRKEKERFLSSPPFTFWACSMGFDDLKKALGGIE